MRSLVSPARLVLGAAMALGMMSMGAFQSAATLVCYYKFDETAGNTAVDSGPNGFNGAWTRTQYLQASGVGDFSPNTPGNVGSIIFTKPAGATIDAAICARTISSSRGSRALRWKANRACASSSRPGRSMGATGTGPSPTSARPRMRP